MAKYRLTHFTAASLADTRSRWEDLIGEDAFELELLSAFDWATDHLESSDGDSVALCLQNVDSNRADAIVEVVSSRRGTMNKMLKVIPSPMFWDVNNQRSAIIDLYVETFFNVMSFGGFKSSHKVKIYGRDDEMMSILRSIHNVWKIDKTKIDFEGRFLAITWE